MHCWSLNLIICSLSFETSLNESMHDSHHSPPLNYWYEIKINAYYRKFHYTKQFNHCDIY